MKLFSEFAFRVLRQDASFDEDLCSSNPDAQMGARYHIRYGSDPNYLPTQFISASTTIEGLLKYMTNTSEMNRIVEPIKVAIINLHFLRRLRVPIHTVADDIRHRFTENYMKETDKKTKNYATCFDEVLIERYVPNLCFMRIFEGYKADFEAGYVNLHAFHY